MKKDIRSWLSAITLLLAVTLPGPATTAHAQTLVVVDDSYGVDFGQPLEVEAFGVLDNDTLDGQNAGENGVTVETVPVSDVSHGTLVLNSDGSFSYTPGTSFTGSDSFIYRAVSDMVTGDATVTLTACSGGPTAFTCWNEAAYLAKLAELGYSTFQEGFEDDAAWGGVRSPSTALSVLSQGITWQTNHPDPPASNEITTGPGPARTGSWGVYDPNHGYAPWTTEQCDIIPEPPVPPPECLLKDGFTGTRQAGETTLYGAGGYFTGLAQPKLVMILDGGTPIPLGFVPVGDIQFFGVIDTAGFTTFRVEETDGKMGQFRFVFGDDFTFGTLPADTTPPQVMLVNSVADTGDGELAEGEVTGVPITELLVSFSEHVWELGAGTDPDSVTNPVNYLLFSDGGDGFQTVDCATGVAAGDVAVSVDSVTYVSGSDRTATVNINGAIDLPTGSYRLLVCGTTSIMDFAGNVLDGNGNGTEGDDFVRNFDVIGAAVPPVPDIKANSQDGPIFVTLGGASNISISLDPGSMGGEMTEWWGILLSSHGTFPLFGFQAPLFNLPETTLFDIALPLGWYIFLFNVENTPDGAYQVGWYDYVIVVVSPAGGAQAKELPDFDALIQEKMKESTPVK